MSFLSDEFRFCVQYFDIRKRVWSLQGGTTSPACIWYRHRDSVPGMMVWAVIGYATLKSLVRIHNNLNADRYLFLTSYVQWLCSILEACKTSSSNKIIQDHMLHVIFWSSSIHRVFEYYPGLHGLQIYHPLRTSGHVLLRDMPAAPLQLILLMKCGIDLKQHGMSDPFLSFKTSSTPRLIGYGPF